MGAAVPKCHVCHNTGGDDERGALDLPGVQVIPDTDLSPRSSPVSPASSRSPSRSRKASTAGGETEEVSGDDPDQDDFEWKTIVSSMLGSKATDAGLIELSCRTGGDFEAMRDVEQEELNREELRVERVSKVIGRVPGERIDAEKMVRASIRCLQDAQGFTTEALAEECRKLQNQEDEDEGNDELARNTKLNKHISRAIAHDRGDYTVTTSPQHEGAGSFPLQACFRKDLRRSASTLSLMSTLGRDVSERLKIIVENPRELSTFYDMDESGDIGKGSYGVVRKAKVKFTGAQRAVKTISKEQCKNGFGALKNEIQISKKVDHPNIVKLYEIFEDSENLYLILELCSEGHLFSYIRSQKTPMKESTSALIMRQVLRGVAYLHSCFIVHRDLKPQNILVVRTDRESLNSMRISDFGLSCEFEPNQMLTAQVGTTAYMAPQVLVKSYTHACDVWSCGVILHILLSGFLPFLGKDASKESIRKAILRGKVKLIGRRWQETSQPAISLMMKMLKVDPSERLTAQSASEHPWLRRHKVKEEATVLTKEEVVTGLQTYWELNVFKRAALHVIVTMLNDEQTSIPRNTFMLLDSDGDGIISETEFADVFGKCDLDPQMFQHAESVAGSDCEQSGSAASRTTEPGISYTQFLAATFDKRMWVQKPVCKAAFSQFDSNGDEQLTLSELVCSSSMLGKLNPFEAEKLVHDFDTNQDGMIDFNEFYSMMRALPVGQAALKRSASMMSKRSRTRSDPSTSSTISRSGQFNPS